MAWLRRSNCDSFNRRLIMASNIYINNVGSDQIAITRAFLGPDPTFEPNFGHIAETVPSNSGDTQVLSIDRSPSTQANATMAELTLSVAGDWVGSLVLMVDSRGSPFKNTLSWMLRGPTENIIAFVSDRNPYTLGFSVNDQRVELTVTGASSGVFDDIYLTVRITSEAVWTKVQAAHDYAANRLIVLAVDSQHRPLLFQSTSNEEPIEFQAIPVSAPIGDKLFHVLLIENYGFSAQAIWAVAYTTSGRLWLHETNSSSSVMLEAEFPGNPSELTSMTASDTVDVGGETMADLFICIANPDQSYQLWRRQLKLTETPGFAGGWEDYGKVSSKRPSYCRQMGARYLFVVRPSGLFSSVAVQYCYANPNGMTYGGWTGTQTLPADISTNSVLALQWDFKNRLHDDIAVAWRGSDGALYVGSNVNSPSYKWLKAPDSRLDGGEMIYVDGSNIVPILFRDPATRQILCLRYQLKEAHIIGPPVSLGSDTPACFSGFALTENYSVTQFAIWQDIATKRPCAVPLAQI